MTKLENKQVAYIQTVLSNHLDTAKVDIIIQDILNDQERIRQIEENESKNLAKIYGLKYSVGTKFLHRGTLFTITEIVPSRPKYPYIAENARGTKYKWAESQVTIGVTSLNLQTNLHR